MTYYPDVDNEVWEWARDLGFRPHPWLGIEPRHLSFVYPPHNALKLTSAHCVLYYSAITPPIRRNDNVPRFTLSFYTFASSRPHRRCWHVTAEEARAAFVAWKLTEGV